MDAGVELPLHVRPHAALQFDRRIVRRADKVVGLHAHRVVVLVCIVFHRAVYVRPQEQLAVSDLACQTHPAEFLDILLHQLHHGLDFGCAERRLVSHNWLPPAYDKKQGLVMSPCPFFNNSYVLLNIFLMKRPR